MISKKIEGAFNKQINAETFSAYLYWSMSAALEGMNLPGFATWMRAQAQEEMLHASKFFDYIIERGGTVTLTAIETPKTKWDDALAIFQDAYGHEQKVTSLINGLVDQAMEERDHASNMFLQWFVTEQVEEEASADEVVQKLKLAGDAQGAMFMLDKEMGARVFTPPASEGGA
jgi:ferritin